MKEGGEREGGEWGERDRETDRDRQRGRQTERETDTQRDRETQGDRQTDRQANRRVGERERAFVESRLHYLNPGIIDYSAGCLYGIE